MEIANVVPSPIQFNWILVMNVWILVDNCCNNITGLWYDRINKNTFQVIYFIVITWWSPIFFVFSFPCSSNSVNELFHPLSPNSCFFFSFYLFFLFFTLIQRFAKDDLFRSSHPCSLVHIDTGSRFLTLYTCHHSGMDLKRIDLHLEFICNKIKLSRNFTAFICKSRYFEHYIYETPLVGHLTVSSS